jgi:arsenate reductase (thioredoxin)
MSSQATPGQEQTGAQRPVRVLVLYTGNSARSQMAGGWLKHFGGGRFEIESAGTKPAEQVNPLAVRVMAEVGIDISAHCPKHLERFLTDQWDFVITVCDSANEACPYFPGGKRRLHWSFEDPAAVQGTEEERLAVFRRVRDEIRERFSELVGGQWA